MRYVTVREISTKARRVWEMLREGEVVVTSNGKPIALLSGVTEETCDRTVKAIRRSRFLLALEEMQKQALERGLDKLTDEEIEAEIHQARKERRH